MVSYWGNFNRLKQVDALGRRLGAHGGREASYCSERQIPNFGFSWEKPSRGCLEQEVTNLSSCACSTGERELTTSQNPYQQTNKKLSSQSPYTWCREYRKHARLRKANKYPLRRSMVPECKDECRNNHYHNSHCGVNHSHLKLVGRHLSASAFPLG